MLAVLINTGGLVFTVVWRPYRHHVDQLLATSAHCMLLMSFFGAVLITAIEEVRDQAEPSVATAIFGFESSEPIVILLFLFTVGMLVLLLSTLVYNITQEGRIEVMRVKGTGRSPELELRRGETYHLFNSHVPPLRLDPRSCARAVD